MVTEMAINYPHSTLIDVIPNELPKNHDYLLRLMVEHARTYPEGEVGGRILTNQDKYTSTIIKVRGGPNSIHIPRLSHHELAVYRAWNTQVVYHSHPIGKSLAFSNNDKTAYQGDTIYMKDHLKISHRLDGVYTVFEYVINADGQFNTMARAFGLTSLVRNTYTIRPTTIAPEKLSLVY